MLKLLIKFLNPLRSIGEQILEWRVKEANAEVEKDRIEAQVQLRQLEAQQAILMAEQGNFITRMIRPLLALPFVIYFWKVVVWDKVLKLGVTDPLGQDLWAVATIVVGSYFISRGAEKLIGIWKR